MKNSKELSVLRNLVYSLILFDKIKTTRAKAKAIQGLVDRLVTQIKKGTSASKREVIKFLTQKPAVEKLTKEIVPKLSSRTSGYTRIIRAGNRNGDNAPMVLMEWVQDGSEKEEEKGEAKEEILPRSPKLPKIPKSPKAENV